MRFSELYGTESQEGPPKDGLRNRELLISHIPSGLLGFHRRAFVVHRWRGEDSPQNNQHVRIDFKAKRGLESGQYEKRKFLREVGDVQELQFRCLEYQQPVDRLLRCASRFQQVVLRPRSRCSLSASRLVFHGTVDQALLCKVLVESRRVGLPCLLRRCI